MKCYIAVQNENEIAFEFSRRVTSIIESIRNVTGKITSIQFTSDQNGRQTANIIYTVNSYK